MEKADIRAGHRSIASATFAAAVQTITAGRNGIPAFRGSFTPEQIRDVSAYVIGPLKSGPPD